jgi:hypothetical protein
VPMVCVGSMLSWLELMGSGGVAAVSVGAISGFLQGSSCYLVAVGVVAVVAVELLALWQWICWRSFFYVGATGSVGVAAVGDGALGFVGVAADCVGDFRVELSLLEQYFLCRSRSNWFCWCVVAVGVGAMGSVRIAAVCVITFGLVGAMGARDNAHCGCWTRGVAGYKARDDAHGRCWTRGVAGYKARDDAHCGCCQV